MDKTRNQAVKQRHHDDVSQAGASITGNQAGAKTVAIQPPIPSGTVAIQTLVDRLNRGLTELKVRAILDDLKETDAALGSSVPKWLKVFCEQISVDGSDDKGFIEPKSVAAWMSQRPDLFDLNAMELIIRHCTEESFNYVTRPESSGGDEDKNGDQNVHHQGNATSDHEMKNDEHQPKGHSHDGQETGDREEEQTENQNQFDPLALLDQIVVPLPSQISSLFSYDK